MVLPHLRKQIPRICLLSISKISQPKHGLFYSCHPVVVFQGLRLMKLVGRLISWY
jgi:hypothetical protein